MPVLGWNSLLTVMASEQASFLRLPPGPWLLSSSYCRAVLRTQVRYVLTHWPGVLINFFPVLHLDFLRSHRILAPSREMQVSLSISEHPPPPTPRLNTDKHRQTPMTACSGVNCASLWLLHPSAVILCVHVLTKMRSSQNLNLKALIDSVRLPMLEYIKSK